MALPQDYSVAQEQTLTINKLIRNTYSLLGMTFIVSAISAGIGMAIGLGPISCLVLSVIGFVLLFVVQRTAESAAGLAWIFVFSAVQGASLGFILNYYAGMENGPTLIMQALGLTAVVFFALSGYALTTKKDFSFLGGFLFAGLVILIVASIANLFLNWPAMDLAIPVIGCFIFSALILFDTSRIINGGETNYIRATLALYLDLLNLFLMILRLLGIGSDD